MPRWARNEVGGNVLADFKDVLWVVPSTWTNQYDEIRLIVEVFHLFETSLQKVAAFDLAPSRCAHYMEFANLRDWNYLIARNDVLPFCVGFQELHSQFFLGKVDKDGMGFGGLGLEGKQNVMEWHRRFVRQQFISLTVGSEYELITSRKYALLMP